MASCTNMKNEETKTDCYTPNKDQSIAKMFAWQILSNIFENILLNLQI